MLTWLFVFDCKVLECIFLESMYWSVGGTLVEAGRTVFDEFIKKIASMTGVNVRC